MGVLQRLFAATKANSTLFNKFEGWKSQRPFSLNDLCLGMRSCKSLIQTFEKKMVIRVLWLFFICIRKRGSVFFHELFGQ